MKRIIPSIVLTLLLIYLLLFPKQMAADTAFGLLLWYKNVVPTLLPFCIISYIIIQSNLYHTIFRQILSLLPGKRVIRPETLYPICLGFVCGFPIGSKLTADMYALGHLNAKEATKLCAISNQFGPAFVVNYIAASQLKDSRFAPILLLSIYLPPLICGAVWMSRRDKSASLRKIPASRSQINFKIIDAGIMNGFETMLRVAGYIVVFSILSGAVESLPVDIPAGKALISGILEITTGTQNIAASDMSQAWKLPLICAIVSFGGFCGLFQTNAIMKGAEFKRKQYITFKLICTAVSFIAAKILYQLFF
ncbi:Uncharacterized protein conserved in bacteria [uncultured Roseburia sp.]|uniref:Sporulation integral membrane protein YlbJ n=1 Tax=Brotonthovivens ammoniilytica TaxID=2981725 RepID=A0ABT2TGF3_9FIRM|nr:hypothetical protein [Brotonthovivens ammoniilytica]MCU6761275.1 hypothetical protein [Brotonthovivens ammoniilytica]SCI24023.1 Uncharacterized protein conserved in bacteria [uncultured Roseburia sp.]